VATAVDRFLQAAADLGVEVDPHHYPEGTRTAADAAAAIGCDVAQIVKSLVFMADDEPVLVLTSGANRVDTHKVGTAVGASTVRKADADQVRAATGFAIGGTPPFGHPAPITTLIDPDLLDFEVVHAAAGTPDTNFGIAPTRLVEVTGGAVTDVAE
jgi:prolyl-tRNA editing enzyme YbaK/EbsC (Cys-tRNA(Pro) deacylase)